MGRRAPERWIVKLWRGEPCCRARFIHVKHEKVHAYGLTWADGQWLEAVPTDIPAPLAARAHRHFRQLQRTAGGEGPGPAARFTSKHGERRHRKVRSFGNLVRRGQA